MEYNIELTDDIKKFECFELLLKKYKDYKSCLRDIKINTILGKKCALNIDEIYPEILCNLKVTEVDLYSPALKINKMSFIIDNSLIISSLKINYEIVDGDYTQKSIESGVLKIYPIKLPNMETGTSVIGFTIRVPF